MERKSLCITFWLIIQNIEYSVEFKMHNIRKNYFHASNILIRTRRIYDEKNCLTFAASIYNVTFHEVVNMTAHI